MLPLANTIKSVVTVVAVCYLNWFLLCLLQYPLWRIFSSHSSHCLAKRLFSWLPRTAFHIAPRQRLYISWSVVCSDFQVFCSMPPAAAIQWAIQLSDLLANLFSGGPCDHMRLSWTVGHLAYRLLRLKLKYPPDAETCTSVYPCLLPLWDTKPAHTRRPAL